MEAAGLVLDAFGRVRDNVRDALKDLSSEELLAPPKPHISWLVQHLSRVQDANFSGLLEHPQLWIADGWYARFNMPPDPKNYGSGHRHTRAQVEAFTITDKPLLLDYLDAVCAQTKSYLATVSNADLTGCSTNGNINRCRRCAFGLPGSSTATRATPVKSNICAVWLSTGAGFRRRKKVAGQRAVVFSGATLQKNFLAHPFKSKLYSLAVLRHRIFCLSSSSTSWKSLAIFSREWGQKVALWGKSDDQRRFSTPMSWR